MSSAPAPILALELTGVFAFALSGALAAVRARLDLFGVVVVAMVTALGGGVLRDLLLGRTPPFALVHWPYLAAAGVAAAVVSWWHPRLGRLRRPILVLDAAGLGLFTVSATQLALDSRLGVAGALVVGVLAGIGGGVIRDLLLREIPLVLRREIYALAALVGAGVICLADPLDLPAALSQAIGALVVFALRLVALRRHWQAPQPRYGRSDADPDGLADQVGT